MSKVDLSLYDRDYFKRLLRPARQPTFDILANTICDHFIFESFVDVGCATGDIVGRLLGAGKRGVGVELSQAAFDLMIPTVRKHVIKADATDGSLPETLGRFDLAICMEVAEHIPTDKSGALVNNLCKTADLIIFSAAPPGQGGTGHVNEQPWTFWEQKFKDENFLEDSALSLSFRRNLSRLHACSTYVNNTRVLHRINVKSQTKCPKVIDKEMMQICVASDHYNWDSYSIVRAVHEILQGREDIEYFSIKDLEKVRSGGYLWLYGSGLFLQEDVFWALNNKGINVINFGLSDPNLFEEPRLERCGLYCTNDLNIYREYNNKHNCIGHLVYHFKPGVDLTKFEKIDAPKDIDVLFIGTLQHPHVPLRKPWLLQLDKDVEGFYGYGYGFEQFLKGEELILGYNRAHLNIDIGTKVSSLSNARILQAATCGVPTLTRKREDVLQYFEDGREILTYEGGYNELVSAIKKALGDKDRLGAIGENARHRCIYEHGMRKQVDDLIQYLGE